MTTTKKAAPEAVDPTRNGTAPSVPEELPLSPPSFSVEDFQVEEPDDAALSLRTDELFDIREFRADLEEADIGASIQPARQKRIPFGKPGKQAWIMAHPDPKMAITVVLIEVATQRTKTTFVVKGKALQDELQYRFGGKRRRLHLAVESTGQYFFWELGLPNKDGMVNSWVLSAYDALEEAQQAWVHVYPDQAQQGYRCDILAPGILPAPQWPDEPIEYYCRLAFKDRTLEEGDHPVLRKLREGV